MKQTVRKVFSIGLLCLLCVAVSTQALQVSAAGKTGWVKKTYYYQKGKKVKNKLKKIKKELYYFDKKGKALKNKWKVVGKYKYYFGKSGKAVKGIVVITKKYDSRFYVFNSKGRLDKTKTKKIQSAAKYQKDFTQLKKLIGNPQKATYTASCMGAGQDGILEYQGFIVFTYLENGKEIFMGVE